MHASPYGVAIPIRSFAGAMVRLAPALTRDERRRLALDLATTVLTAAGDAPVVVVSNDEEVGRWARAHGAATVADPGGLDAAAAAGRTALAARGCARVVVAHGDLPRARNFDSVVGDGSLAVAVIVPCHHDDGSPVLSLPADGPFGFSYGPGSFRRHVAAAGAAGFAVRVVRDADLAFDLDTPEDLAAMAAFGSPTP